ncbi:hypothetical protein AC579_2287 [Pseudocercospora musae]|uniref:Uncharacterized protein n=1 Tax=Pseudocercospora musae TaxID=113226 RepID=A0A139IV39_9PEZI|nr:hypothetical protein AC579_2287 [Pseudocercospora musae]
MTFTPSALSFVLMIGALTAFVFIVGSLTDLDAVDMTLTSMKDQEIQQMLEEIPRPIREKIQSLPAEEMEVMLEGFRGRQLHAGMQQQIDEQLRQQLDVHLKEEVSRRRGSDVYSVLAEFRGSDLDGDLSSFAATL